MLINEFNRPNSIQDAGEILAKAGYELVGSGHYADVWAKPGDDFVLKLVKSSDAAYLDFVKMATASSNPHFPKFKSKLMKVNDAYLAIRMERLGPSKLTEFWMASIKEYARVIIESEGENDPLSADYEAYDEEDQEWVDDLQLMNTQQPGFFDALKEVINKLDHSLDLHPFNFMRRGTTLVITDPVK